MIQKTRKRRIAVIKSLLRAFDLETCMEQYRSINSIEHRLDPKDLSLERLVPSDDNAA